MKVDNLDVVIMLGMVLLFFFSICYLSFELATNKEKTKQIQLQLKLKERTK